MSRRPSQHRSPPGGDTPADPLLDHPAVARDAWPLDPGVTFLRIEVPVIPWPSPPSRLLRISCQLYNALPDYQTLAAALPTAESPGLPPAPSIPNTSCPPRLER